MLSNFHLYKTLREVALVIGHEIDLAELQHVHANQRLYRDDESEEFKRDLVEAGNKVRILLMESKTSAHELGEFIRAQRMPVLVFLHKGGQVSPAILKLESKKIKVSIIGDGDAVEMEWEDNEVSSWLNEKDGQVEFLAIHSYESPVSGFSPDEEVSPVRRLLRLLSTEKKEITYILFYAIVVGFVSLILPLGIQTIVELVSGGVFFSSVYVMIGLVILGIFLTGGLQIIQISLVEFLQRRIFTKAAFEFAFRVPRIRMESILKSHAPELVNRFFDVMTIQKGLPKLLIDLSSSVVQILFGLLLISLYHPFFVFFGMALLGFLVVIFYITGPQGLSSSIQESKYKYKVAYWLEEVARTMQSFKLAGNTTLPVRKTDDHVNNYLKNRKKHFQTLVSQFSFIVLFKALITGGLLIMGTLLVIDRQITLGQFVAAEVVIILVLNAVEKIIMYMDVVYDLLTAVDKVAHITDLPIERTGGFDFAESDKGYEIHIKGLTYRFPGQISPALQEIDLHLAPGATVCIAGLGGSGKTTLTNVLTGLYQEFEGIVTINHHSLRDLDLTHMRDRIAKNISEDDLFDGTLLENLGVGKQRTSVQDVMHALEAVNASDEVNRLPQGLNTAIVSGGKGLPQTLRRRLILARCLAKKPRLMVLNDFFSGLSKKEKEEIMTCACPAHRPWTLVVVSNDPHIMAKCDRVIVLERGKVVASGAFDELLKKNELHDFI